MRVGMAMILGLAAGSTAVAAPPKLDAETQVRITKADAGKSDIDVSGYPETMKANYKTFSKTCAKCHTLARPINSHYVLPDEWSRYVKRMMRKPGSGIRKKDAKSIYEFLTYDSAVRKKDLLEKKLDGLPAEEQKSQREKVKAALSSS